MKVAVQKSNVDEKKAKQVILYVCNRMANSPGFCSTMLNKVLYYADHTHYLKRGKTITGFGYIKQRFGPTPKPAEFLSIRESLRDEGKLGEEQVSFFGKIQKRPVSKVPEDKLDVTCFSATEISDMEEIITAFSSANGTMVSNLSHDELAWKLAGLMEELPHYTYLLTEAQLEEKDLQWGKGQVELHRRAAIR